MASTDKVGLQELRPYMVFNVELTHKVIGTGAYGSVEEARIPGATVAAKKLHRQLITYGSPQQVDKWMRDFVTECKLMSGLRHPNIVQFLGVCYFPDSELPVLLMEKLQTSLDSLLEETPDIPIEMKVHILVGTASGLVCLHSQSPPIAHRDLTARNILIDSNLTAKISDLGVSRMVSIQPGQLAATMTGGPGNLLYMPPEAQTQELATKYNVSIDIFSFGVTSLFTLTQVFPKNLKHHTYRDEVTGRTVARTEIERREEYVTIMKATLREDNPLVMLTLDCMEYLPEDRPSAEAMLRRLEGIRRTLPKVQSKLELVRSKATMESEMQNKDAKIKQLQESNEQFQVTLGEKQSLINRLEQLLAEKTSFSLPDGPVFTGRVTTVDFRALTPDNEPCLENIALHCELVHLKTGGKCSVEVKKGDSNKYVLIIKPSLRGRHELRVIINRQIAKTLPLTVAPDPDKLTINVKVIGQLVEPRRVTVNSKGHFIVVEEVKRQGFIYAYIYDKNWTKLKTFKLCDVQVPDGVTVDSSDNIYITDRTQNRIYRFSPEGQQGKALECSQKFKSPCDIAFSTFFYIAERADKRVTVLNSDFSLRNSFKEELNADLNGICCDENGSVFVADTDNIKMFTAKGEFVRKIGLYGNGPGKLSSPSGIAVNGGIVYVSERMGHRVSMFTVDGEFLGSFGKFGSGPGLFHSPTDVLVHEDQIIVIDNKNNRIQIFDC